VIWLRCAASVHAGVRAARYLAHTWTRAWAPPGKLR
jgi:hypothetical protein